MIKKSTNRWTRKNLQDCGSLYRRIVEFQVAFSELNSFVNLWMFSATAPSNRCFICLYSAWSSSVYQMHYVFTAPYVQRVCVSVWIFCVWERNVSAYFWSIHTQAPLNRLHDCFKHFTHGTLFVLVYFTLWLHVFQAYSDCRYYFVLLISRIVYEYKWVCVCVRERERESDHKYGQCPPFSEQTLTLMLLSPLLVRYLCELFSIWVLLFYLFLFLAML